MPSRPFPPTSSPNFFTKNRILFLALTISASLVIFCSILYLLHHIWHFLKHRLQTNPFNESASLKLQRFSYKELKQATNGFHTENVIGKGGSSTVFKGTLKDGEFIAIKSLDSLSLQSEQEFQNELHILGGLRSPFLVTLLGYCVEKKRRLLVFEYMPKRSLQEFLFGDDDDGSLSWEKRFLVIMDVARALEFLHLGCDPPVIHGDIKPSNVLLDDEYRGKISDFGLSRIKVEEEGEFNDELWKSQEFSGNLTAESAEAIGTPIVESVNEVDFALALKASSSSSKNYSRSGFNVRVLNLNSLSKNASIASENEIRSGNTKGKEISTLDVDRDDEFSSIDHSKELNVNNASSKDEEEKANEKQWGKDWWWRQDESGELCSKDYVMEWLGSQICASNPDWDEEKNNIHKRTELEYSSPTDKPDDAEDNKESKENEITSPLGRVSPCNEPCSTRGINHQICSGGYPGPRPKKEKKNLKKKQRKIQDWWKEEKLSELSKKNCKLKILQTKWKKGFKVPHFELGKRFYLCRRRSFQRESQNNDCDPNEEFSFRKNWRKTRSSPSIGSEMWSGDNLSSTTSMRGTLCYVAPEYGGGCEFLMEKADIYSFGVLILVIVSGRRPLHVLASPMKMEKANLISWCRHLAQSDNILELVDEKLKEDYNKEQASLCINIALSCLQKIPELRPDIGDIVKILKGDMDLPYLPFEFSPSPPSKVYSRSRRKQKIPSVLYRSGVE
ncbi:putative receptor-like protein kinase [Senna tora]|uniref:non-specific serine/threonine protein kinase n=1 Tax=Senna tora TaxID=362788 RepID=A0A835CL91_9FABA|nr:putative receptor-like protein kinase [Senna tora]